MTDGGGAAEEILNLRFFKKFRIIRNGWKSTESWFRLNKLILAGHFIQTKHVALTATSDGFGSVEDLSEPRNREGAHLEKTS